MTSKILRMYVPGMQKFSLLGCSNFSLSDSLLVVLPAAVVLGVLDVTELGWGKDGVIFCFLLVAIEESVELVGDKG